MHPRLQKIIYKVPNFFCITLGIVSALWPLSLTAHSVGQVQTTKFLAADTVNMLLARAGAGSPGLRAGDIITYLIQFSPVRNGADVGAGGYITDYIPPGSEVVDAAIVNKDSAGNFYNIAPSLPGGIDFGWGNRGQKTFGGPFASNTYDATLRCTTPTVFTNNCNARMSELYADTGIFYSTDPRTTVFPALPTRILQGVNGYDISPTAEGNLNNIIGQTRATTHNLWDADQVSAFGSGGNAIVAPSSSAITISNGNGATPYNAGSPVAGPQTGYQLDNTANVGPWQRIAYTGSRMGDSALGPATVQGVSNTAVGGMPTSIGYNLSVSNPLPAGTNAVRWAVGKLVVGEIRYVKISLRLTAAPPVDGIVNSSEVFGGDAGDGDGGQDNVWRYHVPSVADNNSNLLVQKEVVCVFSGAACLPSSSGGYIPTNAKVRYRIVYLNSGVVSQTNLVLQDILPCQTGADAVSFTTTAVISGSITLPVPNPPVTAAGNCPTTRNTVTFPTLSSLAPGAGGAILIDVQTNAGSNAVVANTAKLSSSQVPGGVQSTAVSNVNALPSLAISKIANITTTLPGDTTSYSIVVENIGAGDATGIVLTDILPSMGGASNPATRFSFNTTTFVAVSSSPAGSTLSANPAVALSVPPTLAPYNTSPLASNSQQVVWTFASSTLVPGGKMTLTYTANVGGSVTASATPYLNTAVVTYAGGGAGRGDAPNTAPVLVTSPLSVSKTIECYFVGGNCIPIGSGGNIPANARIRYQINYANTGASAINNVILSDTLPCQTPINAVSNIQIITGPIALPLTNPPTTAAGVCPSTRSSFTFPPTTLAAGETGSVKLDVTTNAVVGAVVVNTANISAAGFPSAASDAQASVAAQPVLQIVKIANTASAAPGTTLSYTITVSNSGTTAAQTITVYDWLPSSSPTNNTTTRFSYVAGSSVVVGALSAPTIAVGTPTQAPYNSLAANPNANNQDEVRWNFGSQTLAPGASFSITFVALVGINMPVPANYDNYARASFSAGAANSGVASANIGLMAKLSVSKDNGATSLVAGSTTAYTITFSNQGPSNANGAVVKDAFSAGLSCTTVTCVATTGTPLASCPSSMLPQGTAIPIGATNFFSTGETIATFPPNSSVTLLVVCNVTATGQ
jgi:uncharacterized repeat protein (TIGR01451 family)